MSFSLKVKEELTSISRKDFTSRPKQSNMGKGPKFFSEADRRASLRNAFLHSGSISDPEKFYHLEIVLTTEEEAEKIQRTMKEFGLDGRITRRKGHYVVYLKESAQIADMLSAMEAYKALMEFENVRILKDVRNSINRQVNCEAANLGKTISASVKQMEDIRFICESVGLDELADNLAETARMRLEYPDATLKELGEMMDPPVGKSGMNHRLRKLSEIAEKLRSHKEEKYYD